MKTTENTNCCRVSLGGIPHWATWGEGRVTFSQTDGVYGHGARITVEKTNPHELLYVRIADNLRDAVPAAHVHKAVELAATVLGPDHFPSLEAEREYKRRQPWFKLSRLGGWRSGLLQIKGRAVLRWGAWAQKRPTTLAELAANQRDSDDVASGEDSADGDDSDQRFGEEGSD